MRLRWLLVLSILACVFHSLVSAETVVETWRSPFGSAQSVSVNSTDGSCWAATGSSVMHLTGNGVVLSESHGFWSPTSVSVNSTDGSCWVADTNNNEVVHLGASGIELWRGEVLAAPQSVSVNSTDGSCWVAGFYGHVAHLSESGVWLWGVLARPYGYSVCVNPNDGSCWLTDSYLDDIVHVSATGDELWRGGGFLDPRHLSVDAADGSCWVADEGNHQAVHLSPSGVQLWRGGSFDWPHSVSVDPSDGACWVADRAANTVVRLSAAGEELLRVAGGVYGEPRSVSADPADSSCWVADRGSNCVLHLSAAGVEVAVGIGFNQPISASVDIMDGSCWVTDTLNAEVVHLSALGTELWRGGGFSLPYSVSVNSVDGSCWVADYTYGEVIHLSEMGVELWRGGGFSRPCSVSVNPEDGSCWVVDSFTDEVVHLSEAGVALWRGGDFSYPVSVSVNPNDGSCWVADDSEVVHLSAAGAELWRGGGFAYPYSVSVNPGDGSCWVADTDNNEIVHVSAAGAELWRGGGFTRPYSASIDPSDGSCWVADSSGGVVHLSATGVELWRGGKFSGARCVSVNPSDGSCWVTDTWDSQVVRLITVVGSDLAVSALSVTPPSHAADPEVTTFAVTVVNNGSSATAACDLDIFTDRSAEPESDKRGEARLQLPALEPGETITLTARLAVGGGSHKAWARVDVTDQVSETDETNNGYGPISYVVPGVPTVATAFWDFAATGLVGGDVNALALKFMDFGFAGIEAAAEFEATKGLRLELEHRGDQDQIVVIRSGAAGVTFEGEIGSWELGPLTMDAGAWEAGLKYKQGLKCRFDDPFEDDDQAMAVSAFVLGDLAELASAAVVPLSPMFAPIVTGLTEATLGYYATGHPSYPDGARWRIDGRAEGVVGRAEVGAKVGPVELSIGGKLPVLTGSSAGMGVGIYGESWPHPDPDPVVGLPRVSEVGIKLAPSAPLLFPATGFTGGSLTLEAGQVIWDADGTGSSLSTGYFLGCESQLETDLTVLGIGEKVERSSEIRFDAPEATVEEILELLLGKPWHEMAASSLVQLSPEPFAAGLAATVDELYAYSEAQGDTPIGWWEAKERIGKADELGFNITIGGALAFGADLKLGLSGTGVMGREYTSAAGELRDGEMVPAMLSSPTPARYEFSDGLLAMMANIIPRGILRAVTDINAWLDFITGTVLAGSQDAIEAAADAAEGMTQIIDQPVQLPHRKRTHLPPPLPGCRTQNPLHPKSGYRVELC